MGVERAGMLGLLRQDWGLEAWPGAQLLCISRWRREKCQLILDCKHIPVPTPLIMFLLQPPSPSPRRASPLPITEAVKKERQSPWDSCLGSEETGTAALMLLAVWLWASD